MSISDTNAVLMRPADNGGLAAVDVPGGPRCQGLMGGGWGGGGYLERKNATICVCVAGQLPHVRAHSRISASPTQTTSTIHLRKIYEFIS